MICAAFDNFAGLVVFRFILGAFESSISPCMSTSIGEPEGATGADSQ
jgi:MFS family permease